MVVNCPICKSESKFSYALDRKKILSALDHFFGQKFEPGIIKADYSMYKCPSCALEFANPLLAGDDDFYNALTAVTGYYPTVRGEYQIAADHINKTKGLTATILDIGCGGGDFLVTLKKQSFTAAIGLDATEKSVISCREKGVEAYCDRIETFSKGPFDAITSFHCLEHVEDPVGFVQSALTKLSGDGRIYISTPYAPQTIEFGWFHPLNHPPHHMLRLYRQTYETLAKVTGTSVEFINFGSTSFSSQVRTAFAYAVYGHNVPASATRMFFRMLLRPFLVGRIISKVRDRIRNYGEAAGPDILVVFKRLAVKS